MNEEFEDEEKEKEDEEDNINSEALADIKKVLSKLDYRDIIIIALIVLMFLMYVYHGYEIDRCVYYFNGLIRNQSLRALAPVTNSLICS